PRLVPHSRAEHFLHQPSPAPAGRVSGALGVAAAVGPDRMRHAPEGDQTLVVALLVAVVDRGARKQAVTVVLVRAPGRDPQVGHPIGPAIGGAREVDVGHESLSGRIVLRVVVGGGHLAGGRIDGEPLIEAVRSGTWWPTDAGADQVKPAVGSWQRSCGRESQRFVLRSETGRPGPLALAPKAFQIPRSAVRPGPPLAEKGPASVCRRSSTPPDSETLIPPRRGPLT